MCTISVSVMKMICKTYVCITVAGYRLQCFSDTLKYIFSILPVFYFSALITGDNLVLYICFNFVGITITGETL